MTLGLGGRFELGCRLSRQSFCFSFSIELILFILWDGFKRCSVHWLVGKYFDGSLFLWRLRCCKCKLYLFETMNGGFRFSMFDTMNRSFRLGRRLIGLMVKTLVRSFFQFGSQSLFVNVLTPLKPLYLHLQISDFSLFQGHLLLYMHICAKPTIIKPFRQFLFD
jgi:hypothetical protein